ncbi:hypothetical protein ATER59S_01004 [Aquamicrobium terrae]
MATYTNAELVAQIYIGLYNRAPDPEGLQYWIGRLEAGATVQDLGDSFATSPEAQDTYPYLKFPGLLSPADFLNQVYLNVFGRPIDVGPDSGLEYYSARLASGESVGSVVASILGNAADNEGSADQAYLANKVAVGLYWANEAAATPGFEYDRTGPTGASAHDVISHVNADSASVDAGKAASDAFFDGPTGNPIPLTPGVDNLTGTSGADLFQGTVTATAGTSTFNDGDTINGAGGKDVLRVIASNTAATTVFPTLTDVETLEFQAYNTGALTVNLSTSTGVETVSRVNGNGNIALTNVGNIVDASFTNTTGGTLNIGYNASVVAGTADVQKVALNNATGTLTVNGIETLDINAKGGVNDLTINAGGLETIDIAGAGDLTIANALAATVTKVDGSAATGDLSLTVGHSKIEILGGSGDDTVTFAGANLLNKTDTKIDLGEGHNVVITGDNNYATTANVDAINAMKNVDVLGTSATGSVIVNLARFTSIHEFATMNAVSGTAGAAGTAGSNGSGTGAAGGNAGNGTGGGIGLSATVHASGDVIDINADITGGAGGNGGKGGNGTNGSTNWLGNYTGAGGQGGNGGQGGDGGTAIQILQHQDTANDSLTFNFDSGNAVSINAGAGGAGGAGGTGGNGTTGRHNGLDGQAGTAADYSVDAHQLEHLTIATGSADDAVTFGNGSQGSILLAKEATITVTGEGDVNLGHVAVAAAGAKGEGITVDASASSGKISLTGTGYNDVIHVGSGGSDLGASDGSDIYHFGDGKDIIHYSAGSQSGDGDITSLDVIHDFGSNDVIDLSGFGIANANQVYSQATLAAELANQTGDLLAYANAAALHIGANHVGAFDFNGDTYVIANDGAAGYGGGDLLIKLVGHVDLDAAHFGFVA